MDTKLKNNVIRSNAGMQQTIKLQTIHNLEHIFPDFCQITADIPDSYQIAWHFQVFQTSGHPALSTAHSAIMEAFYSNNRSPTTKTILHKNPEYEVSNKVYLGVISPDISPTSWHYPRQISKS